MASSSALASRYRLIAGYAIALLAGGFLVRQVISHWGEYSTSLSDVRGWSMAVALASALLGLWLNAWSFGAACRACGVDLPRRTLCGAWLGTLVSKYAPIGVGHVVGRGIALSQHGVSSGATVKVGIFEQGVSLAWCGVIALIAFCASEPWSSGLGMVVLLFALMTIALLLVRVSTTRFKWWGISAAGYGVAMVPYALTYVVLVAPNELAAFIAALFSGTIAGVAAFVVPGGLGVRELVASLLMRDGDAARTVAGMAAARAIIVVAEVLGTVAGQRMLGWRSA